MEAAACRRHGSEEDGLPPHSHVAPFLASPWEPGELSSLEMDLYWAALCILIGVCALFYIGSLASCLTSDESDVPGGVDTAFTGYRAAPNSGEGGQAQHHYHHSRQENKR